VFKKLATFSRYWNHGSIAKLDLKAPKYHKEQGQIFWDQVIAKQASGTVAWLMKIHTVDGRGQCSIRFEYVLHHINPQMKPA
jgi:hypothetical protein